MLFVFKVDTGRMMTFDMAVAFETVADLKLQIEKVANIPTDKQVLLVSGGEELKPEDRICARPSCGTDTNPIFLFSKAIIEWDQAPSASIDYRGDYDMAAKVRESSDLPATYATVQKRAQLARSFCEVSQSLLGTCEKLVHEQHLQQQGWAAAVANLEDLTAAIKRRWNVYQERFEAYFEKRQSYIECLRHFKDDLITLQQIPILPALTQTKKMLVPEQDDTESKEIENVMTLWEWITQKDDFMDCLYHICSKGLLQTDENQFHAQVKDLETTLENTENLEMKEIGGLGNRLFGLEQLLTEAKRYVGEQGKLAESFQRNRTRASETKEASVLPDLCATHSQQLNVLLDNHNRLVDILRRFILAKNELSANLYLRLRWVVFTQGSLCELDYKIVFNGKSLEYLQNQLNILEQIHSARSTYLACIVEVVRRRKISQAFLVWASDLACHLSTLRNDEIAKRKDFQQLIEGHFLRSLFPGMDDLPPTFATEPPPMYDSDLPKLIADDVERLRQRLPDLADCLQVPDTTNVTNYFMLKEAKDEALEDKLIEMAEGDLKASDTKVPQTTPHGLPHLKDLDRGCESETDTEEFEKVGQSPFELHFDKASSLIPSPRPGTQDAATLTEVGERLLPPKKPPRTFQKPPPHADERTLSLSATESFTNLKNPSLESIDELSSLKNFTSNTESCFNSHHQQMIGRASSKSVSPQSPPKGGDSPGSPMQGAGGHHQPDFVNDEFYIDESLPSSLSCEAGHSQGSEFVKQLDTANNVVALLQDTLQISRSEYEKLKTTALSLSKVGLDELSHLRRGLTETKSSVTEEKLRLDEAFADLTVQINKIVAESENAERELVQRLTVDHELEISDFRKIAQSKNEEIKGLRDGKNAMQNEIEKLVQENRELKQKMEDKEKELEEMRSKIDDLCVEKEKCIKEVTERLKSDHKSELESIRARFKLMTMERSPSENSLEKIDSSITNHEALLMQMTENFESEKEVAVSDAVSKESVRWQKVLEDKIKEVRFEFEQEKNLLLQDVQSRIQQDQEKRINQLKEQINNLSLECVKYKDTIQQLTEYGDMSEKFYTMEQENASLRAELDKVRAAEPSGMAASVAVCEGAATSDAATSPVKSRKRSEIYSPKSGTLHIETCKSGDLVLVVWDMKHQNFKILQKNPALFFLNADCMDSLGLKIVEGQPNKLYCYAEVIEKEYCHARKPINRFKVPQGTKFFRVKVKPHSSEEAPHMSQSHTVTSQTPIPEMQPLHSLPSSPSRGAWDKPEVVEEKGEEAERNDEEIEKATELTENFNAGVDRCRMEDGCLPLSRQNFP